MNMSTISWVAIANYLWSITMIIILNISWSSSLDFEWLIYIDIIMINIIILNIFQWSSLNLNDFVRAQGRRRGERESVDLRRCPPAFPGQQLELVEREVVRRSRRRRELDDCSAVGFGGGGDAEGERVVRVRRRWRRPRPSPARSPGLRRWPPTRRRPWPLGHRSER